MRKVAVGMSVVAAVALATGIVFAPKSGKETREDMKKRAVNTIETIKDTVQKKTEKVRDSADHTAREMRRELRNTMNNVHEKTEGVKKDIKDGYHEIAKDHPRGKGKC